MQERNFFVNLNVILMIDWLSRYHYLLNCSRKKVIFAESGISDNLSANPLNVTLREGSSKYLLAASVEEKKEEVKCVHVRVTQRKRGVFFSLCLFNQR